LIAHTPSARPNHPHSIAINPSPKTIDQPTINCHNPIGLTARGRSTAPARERSAPHSGQIDPGNPAVMYPHRTHVGSSTIFARLRATSHRSATAITPSTHKVVMPATTTFTIHQSPTIPPPAACGFAPYARQKL